MKTLYLLRHAKSSWKNRLEDFDRPLNKRGRDAAAAMGRLLAEKQIHPSQVLCSSSRRTRETLARIQDEMGTPIPARFEKGLYLADAAALLRRVKRLNDSLLSVMLIGHNPGLEQLALALAERGDSVLSRQLAAKFPTGSLAVLESEVGRWGELQPGRAILTQFVRPRDLTPEG
jgi:phosphohistidine phosphatase